jgi:hypothetical protein
MEKDCCGDYSDCDCFGTPHMAAAGARNQGSVANLLSDCHDSRYIWRVGRRPDSNRPGVLYGIVFMEVACRHAFYCSKRGLVVIDKTKQEDVSLAVYLKKLADDMNYAALLRFTESRKADAK